MPSHIFRQVQYDLARGQPELACTERSRSERVPKITYSIPFLFKKNLDYLWVSIINDMNTERSKTYLLFFTILLLFVLGNVQNTVAQEVITIPNVFTPNNDGINDEFKVNLNGNTAKSYHISIFSNWGTLVFNAANSNIHWDGRTTSGMKATEGAYFYVLDFNGQQYKGTLILLE